MEFLIILLGLIITGLGVYIVRTNKKTKVDITSVNDRISKVGEKITEISTLQEEVKKLKENLVIYNRSNNESFKYDEDKLEELKEVCKKNFEVVKDDLTVSNKKIDNNFTILKSTINDDKKSLHELIEKNEKKVEEALIQINKLDEFVNLPIATPVVPKPTKKPRSKKGRS